MYNDHKKDKTLILDRRMLQPVLSDQIAGISYCVVGNCYLKMSRAPFIDQTGQISVQKYVQTIVSFNKL